MRRESTTANRTVTVARLWPRLSLGVSPSNNPALGGGEGEEEEIEQGIRCRMQEAGGRKIGPSGSVQSDSGGTVPRS
jgi:hypothetical protein